MLKCRLIPKLQMKRVQMAGKSHTVLVTTRCFDQHVVVGDPVSQAKIYQSQAADELIFLDLDATAEERLANLEVLRRTCREVFMPITVGGGVASLEDFRQLLASGADKVSVNTAAVLSPDLIRRASLEFGAQCVVLSIDCRRQAEGTVSVFTHGGSQKTDWDPVEWAREGVRLGAGEILVTSIDRDGTETGLDLELARQVSRAVAVPVIASGGCGLASHFVEGWLKAGVHAVAAGTFFSRKDQNPMQTRSHISNADIPIRIHL